jgi:hypothetical protein
MIISHFLKEVENGVQVLLIPPGTDTAKYMVFKDVTIEMMKQAHEDYTHGRYIQDAYSFLSADQRNFLITGMLPEED